MENLIDADGNAQWNSYFENSLQISYKVIHTRTSLHRRLLLCVHLVEVKTYAYTNTSTEMFIATLFIIAPN